MSKLHGKMNCLKLLYPFSSIIKNMELSTEWKKSEWRERKGWGGFSLWRNEKEEGRYFKKDEKTGLMKDPYIIDQKRFCSRSSISNFNISAVRYGSPRKDNPLIPATSGFLRQDSSILFSQCSSHSSFYPISLKWNFKITYFFYI